MSSHKNEQANLIEQAENLLSAYIDGEVSAAEQKLVETALAESSALRAELESLRQTVTLLQQMPRVAAPRPFTLSAADVDLPAAKKTSGFLSGWFKPFAGAMAGLAAALAVVFMAASLLPGRMVTEDAASVALAPAMEAVEQPAAEEAVVEEAAMPELMAVPAAEEPAVKEEPAAEEPVLSMAAVEATEEESPAAEAMPAEPPVLRAGEPMAEPGYGMGGGPGEAEMPPMFDGAFGMGGGESFGAEEMYDFSDDPAFETERNTQIEKTEAPAQSLADDSAAENALTDEPPQAKSMARTDADVAENQAELPTELPAPPPEPQLVEEAPALEEAAPTAQPQSMTQPVPPTAAANTATDSGDSTWAQQVPVRTLTVILLPVGLILAAGIIGWLIISRLKNS